MTVALSACGGGGPDTTGEVTHRSSPDAPTPSRSDRRIALENAYPSIRGFGSVATGSEATAIVSALTTYLRAVAGGEWPRACDGLHPVLRANLEAHAPSCARALEALVGGFSDHARRRAARIAVAAVRRRGDRAFVVYATPGTISADMPLIRAHGTWTVDAIQAYVLTPEQKVEGGRNR